MRDDKKDVGEGGKINKDVGEGGKINNDLGDERTIKQGRR